ncbi:heterokaryon incompatibility protein-domain-containing protein [Lasiosphaeria ovina]|uniref:Heterokaryon incompatibility protein-domain-containing protein n=1 Tax=Lasiosphaeria ovina TaxID=92902 RepID=A0AAE0NFJ8_9PEZI|nr:heterokaryon incompatibility protein-domain-containing protein [Lasiosphaeria ovina]
MRLLNTRTLQLESFLNLGDKFPFYSILSHTWEDDEVLFSDMADLAKARQKAGFAKVEAACALAASQYLDYIWIDTCCIDKSSSAELAEAITSMYQWYRFARTCYAYLCDVDDVSGLTKARWFTRGWTLQELIAPGRVEFYSSKWQLLGEKKDEALMALISRASNVDEMVLVHKLPPSSVSVARKMFWASGRTTSRVEDEAYCLMGLFDINMPLIYGEGSRAFRRLQEEIIKISDDQSILAWYWLGEPSRPLSRPIFMFRDILAPSPRHFALSGGISMHAYRRPYLPTWRKTTSLTKEGLRLAVMVRQDSGDSAHQLTGRKRVVAVLACQVGSIPGTYPTLILTEDGKSAAGKPLYYRVLNEAKMSTFSPGAIALFPRNKTQTAGASLDTAQGPPLTALYAFQTQILTRQDIVLLRSVLTEGSRQTQPRSPPTVLFFSEYNFLLVSLPCETQKAIITVSDLAPPDSWDRTCLHFVTTRREDCCDKYNIQTHKHRVGAASILVTTREAKSHDGAPVVKRAIIVFGTTHPFPDTRPFSPDKLGRFIPWCHLLENNGSLNLKDVLEAGAGDWEDSGHYSALALDPNTTLCAAAGDGKGPLLSPNECMIRLSVEKRSENVSPHL